MDPGTDSARSFLIEFGSEPVEADLKRTRVARNYKEENWRLRFCLSEVESGRPDSKEALEKA